MSVQGAPLDAAPSEPTGGSGLGLESMPPEPIRAGRGRLSFACTVFAWALAVTLFLAFFARGVVTLEELRSGRWTEYLVFRVASERLRTGDEINVLPPADPSLPAWVDECTRRAEFVVDPAIAARVGAHVYSYPPLLAWFTSPIAMIDDYGAESRLWYLLIAGLEIIAVAASIRLVLGARREVSLGERLVVFVAIVACARFLIAPIANQQVDTVLFAALVLGGVVLAARRHPAWTRQAVAGVLIGFAAGAKGPLALAAPLLFVRRLPVAAVSVGVSALAWNLLPDVFAWPDSDVPRIVSWWESVARPAGVGAGTAATFDGIWERFNLQNQSLGGMVNRWFAAGRPANVPPAIVEFSDLGVGAVAWSVSSLLLLAGLASARVASTRGGDAGTAVPAGASLEAVESTAPPDGWSIGVARDLAIVICLALLLSPMTSMAHYCGIVLPVLVLARTVYDTRDRIVLVFLVLGILAGILGKDLLGRDLGESFRFYGQGVWVALLLLLGLVRASWLTRRR